MNTSFKNLSTTRSAFLKTIKFHTSEHSNWINTPEGGCNLMALWDPLKIALIWQKLHDVDLHL